MQPINYLPQGVPDPFGASMLGAYKAGVDMQQVQFAQQQQQQALAAAQAKAERDAFVQQRLSEFMGKDPKTLRLEDYQAVTPLLPKEQADSLRANFELQSKEQQNAQLSFGGQVMAAFQADQPQIGIQLLRERAQAARNTGKEEDAKAYETWAQLAEVSPDQALKTIGGMLAVVPGGDKVVKAVIEAAAGPATIRQAEGTAREAVAKAATAEVTAANAPELARIEVAQKGAAAKIEQFKAREEELRAAYAPQRVKIEVEKLGADLGLTRAQIGQASAAAAASRASAAASSAAQQAAKAQADMARAGLLPPAQRAEAEAKLRAEYSKETKVFQDVRESYRRVNVSEDNAVGDLALIFGFMKMLDPGSVVREGEFATAQNAAGVPERVQNLYNRALRGERLTASQRAAFKGQAKQVFSAAQQQEQTVRAGLSRVATGYGLDTKNIFFEDAAPPTPAPTPTSDKKPPLSSFLK